MEAPREPERHQGRGGGEDRRPAPALPLRAPHDRHVPEALPRSAGQPSGVWRILRRLDMSRLPASQRYRRHTDRWKRYEKPVPGHRVQIDVKFIAPLLNQSSAIRFLDYVLEKLPFKVEVIQTDHGAEFGSQFHD